MSERLSDLTPERVDPDDARPGTDAPSVAGREEPKTQRHDQNAQPSLEDAPKDRDKEPPPPPPKTVFVIAGLIVVAGVAWGTYTHWRDYRNSQETTSETLDRPVDVRTIEAKRQDGPINLTVPGQTEAFDMANIYPRATGYVGERRVDIGTRVKTGDLLVHIVAPDLDQQLAQAQAQMGQTVAAKAQAQAQAAQAEANLNLAQVTFSRTNQLTHEGYATQQTNDNQEANLQAQRANVENAKAGIAVADANIKAQQATIDRLQALAAFENVRAPFDGVITSRSVDTGDLLNADSSTGTPMFTIVQNDVVRVTVRVPQSDAIGVTDGLEASVTVAQMPGRVFKGTVTRSSDALLYASRTLTTEVDVPNPDGALKSGLYVSVTLRIPREQPDVDVPSEALVFNQHGMQVATVVNDQIKFVPITIYRDHGISVDVKEGLRGGERIVLSPPALLTDGSKIKENRQDDGEQSGT